ncbi:MAG: universal stress protein [Bradymonadaceae bacterium]|nr:universal stress protein [Lujinxingiaceae bacterium]
MFQRILLATDGSEHAERAADAALGLARELSDAHVTLLHVSSQAPSRGQLLQANLDIKSLLEAEAHATIASIESKFTEAGLPYRLEVALGDPAQKIVEIAAARGIDLIVIGSRGLGPVSAVLLGSVSHRVAHDAGCPVMIVK